MSATCPSCGGPVGDTEDRCHRCGQGTNRRFSIERPRGLAPSPSAESPPPPPIELVLPCPVGGARYVAGTIWTHGLVYLTDAGLYLLAEADGPWSAERLLEIVPEDLSKPASVAPASSFLPLAHIVRIQHSRLTKFQIVTRDGEIPLRLEAEGWRLIDAFGAKTGLPTK